MNAVTDYLSYVVTLWLVDRGRQTFGWAFAMGLADVLAAAVIFVLLGAFLVAVVSGANALAGVDLFPLAPLFKDLHANPGNYLWLYVMLFSTLAPTLAHLAVAVFSMVALPFFALVAVPLSQWIKVPDTVKTFGAPLVLGGAATASLALPVLMAYCLYTVARLFVPDLALVYLGWLESLARTLGAG